MKPASSARDGETFYLFVASPDQLVLSSDSVFYKVSGEQLAATLCRLFCKEYPCESGRPGSFLKCADEVDPDEQILLDESLDRLGLYDDPDPGVYDPPPPNDVMRRAE